MSFSLVSVLRVVRQVLRDVAVVPLPLYFARLRRLPFGFVSVVMQLDTRHNAASVFLHLLFVLILIFSLSCCD